MFRLLKSIVGGAGKYVTPRQYMAEFVDEKRPHTLIDVRTAEEFIQGHIPGAVNIDLQVLTNRLKDVPKDKAVVLYCRSGNRSGQAAGLLHQAGFTEIYDLGGIGDWQTAGFSIK
jgi:rhodanese-related sulfurtransferase